MNHKEGSGASPTKIEMTKPPKAQKLLTAEENVVNGFEPLVSVAVPCLGLL